MWSTLAHPWQVCLSQLWDAYCSHEIPCFSVGAVIVDAAGQVLSSGAGHRLPPDRIRIFPDGPNHPPLREHILAHAEMQALLSLDETRPNIVGRQCSLYTTLEPCPMCLGAICMCNSIGHLHYAARDPLGGAVGLLDATAFLQRKKRRTPITSPADNPLFELVVTTLTLTAEICNGSPKNGYGRKMTCDLMPAASLAADVPLESGLLSRWREQHSPIEEVIDVTQQLVSGFFP